MADNNDNSISTKEAGQKGGQQTRNTHGDEFYRNNGQKGGHRTQELVEKGKQSESSDK